MEEQEKSIQDYLAIVSRRKVSILVTASIVFIMGIVVALVWPPTFRSTATILIKEQEIPTELVRSTVTSYAAQRIETIKQRVMTRPNLMEIIQKYSLYTKKIKTKTSEEILEIMREDILLNMISADVMDPRTGRPGVATIAFTLSYDGSNPESTQKVTGELTSLFLAENLKTRKEKAAETYTFLTDETAKLEVKIAESEKKLAEFKEINVDSLPEMTAISINMLNRTESEILSIDSELRSIQERRFYLESQLAQINPLTNMRSATGVTILDPVSRLKSLESEYASLISKYSDQHPDIVKIKREIEGLKSQTGVSDSGQELAKQLTQKRSDLGALTDKYSETHPDVISLKSEIASLENAIAVSSSLPERTVMEMQPDNPAYITVQSQLQTVESELSSLSIRKAQLEEKLEKLETNIARTPQVEKEYQLLNRELQSALSRYQDIKSRQMEAEIGQELEKESKGESFVLIDPAQFPEKPVKPNRLAIVFLALVFSIASGLGVAILKEAVDSSIRGVLGVTRILTAAPLAVIPVIYNSQDLYRKRKMNRIMIGSALGSVIIAVLLVHFLWAPLDVLWFKGIRKAEDVIGV